MVYSFSLLPAYQYLSGTRCKPWENRELDALDGIKVLLFLAASTPELANSLFYSSIDNLLSSLGIISQILATVFVSGHLFVECFYMISVFFVANRCFEIMESKRNVLSIKDILKIYTRKFFRVAPAYYSIWLLLWVIYPRAGEGPLWHNTQMNFSTCKEDFLPTLLFVGNIYPIK